MLPLRNIGGDATQDYFADGMTSALITELAKVESLNVISQTSVMRYRERSDRSLPQIGKELGVDAIVEGSVLRVGDRVRISVDLVHATTDRHLWAQSYEQPLVDVLSLQSEVARAVVGHIQSRVTSRIDGGGPRQARVHPEAYELFLRGELSVAQGNPTGVDRAVGYYERALALDPDFAPAHAGLAGAHFAQEFWGTAPRWSNVDKVRASVARALSLDPNLADAHVMKARILLNYDWDWAGTEASLKRAIDLSPGLAFAYETYCWLLLGQGRRDEAVAAARKTVTLDPRSSYMAFTEGRVLHRVRRYREAEDAYKRAIHLDPGFPIPYSALALLYTTERRFAEAREMLDRRGPPAVRARGSISYRVARGRIRQQGPGAGVCEDGRAELAGANTHCVWRLRRGVQRTRRSHRHSNVQHRELERSGLRRRSIGSALRARRRAHGNRRRPAGCLGKVAGSPVSARDHADSIR